MQNKLKQIQTLSEEQFNLLTIVHNEYETGLLALNSLGPNTLTVYGGSRITKESQDFIDIQLICKMLAERKWGIASGGGPGVMTAALNGTKEGGGKTMAFCINIPGEPSFENPDVKIIFTQFSIRKYILRQSDAFIFAPGGIGTLDEMMELLTLIQTNKYQKKPIFLYNSKFWSGYIDWMKNILIEKYELVPNEFLNLFYLVDSPNEIMSKLY